jgi:hypothetical protein
VRLFVVPVRTFLCFKSRDEIFFKGGEGCDTPNVTVAATVFLQYLYSVIRNVTWFKFEFKFKSCL